MSKLLIEDIAVALNTNPHELSDLERRNLCILIDWTMTLLTHRPGESSTPLLSSPLELSDETTANVTAIIVKAIQENTFPELRELKPDSEKMDNMFKRLGKLLGFSNEVIDDIDTGFISDYESRIKSNGLVYTTFLTYRKSLGVDEQKSLDMIQYNLAKAHPWQTKKPLFHFDAQYSTLKIENALSDNSNTSYYQQFHYLLDLLHSVTYFQHQYNQTISFECVQQLSGHLRHLAPKIIPDKYVEKILTNIIQTIKTKVIAEELRKILCDFVMHQPQLRSWKTYDSYAQNIPVHRIILMGHEDIVDEEIIRTVDMIYKNHPHENIAVTYSPNDVSLVQNPFTLQVIGHGVIADEQSFNANLGPFRGNATVTGQQLADLVNRCPLVSHVRLSCCFSGKLSQIGILDPLTEKQRSVKTNNPECRKSFTLPTTNLLSTANSPFAHGTAAISCWNAIDKQNRKISITVSPGIIEPDEMIGHMVWKESLSDLASEMGVKEICITNSNDRKYLPLLELKKKIQLQQETELAEQFNKTKLHKTTVTGNLS